MPAALSDLHRIGIKVPCTDASFPVRELVPLFQNSSPFFGSFQSIFRSSGLVQMTA